MPPEEDGIALGPPCAGCARYVRFFRGWQGGKVLISNRYKLHNWLEEMTKDVEEKVLNRIQSLINKFQRELYLTAATWAFAIVFLSTHASGSYADFFFPFVSGEGLVAGVIFWFLLLLGVVCASVAITLSAYIVGNTVDLLLFSKEHKDDDELPKARIGFVATICVILFLVTYLSLLPDPSTEPFEGYSIALVLVCSISGGVFALRIKKLGGGKVFRRMALQLLTCCTALFIGGLLLVSVYRDEYKSALVTDFKLCRIQDELLSSDNGPSIDDRVKAIYELNKVNCLPRFGRPPAKETIPANQAVAPS